MGSDGVHENPDEKVKKEIDPYSLEDVPGLGPVSMKALIKEGFQNAFQIIHKDPVWLKNVTGMDVNVAIKAFEYMRNKLVDAGLINRQEYRGDEILEQREKIQRLLIGARTIDNLLDGGIEAGSVTEFYGEEGGGKTQIGHTFAVQCLRSIKDGGFAEEGKEKPLVMYIDTETTFRPERITTILAGKGLISDIPIKIKKKVLENKILTADEIKEMNVAKQLQKKEAKPWLHQILVEKPINAMQQMVIIQNAITMVKPMNIKLLIVDSGTAFFRSDFLGRGNLKSRTDLIQEMLHDLKALANHCEIPVVFINQVYESPTEDYGRDPIIPVGGHVLGHTNTMRVKVMLSGRSHKMRIMKSPKDDNNECKFDIEAAGIVDKV